MVTLFKTTGIAVYVHPQMGSDIFGTGTIDRPFASWTRAHAANTGRKCLRGILIENGVGGQIEGDEMYQTIIGQVNISGTSLFKIQAPISYTLVSNTTNCKGALGQNATAGIKTSNGSLGIGSATRCTIDEGTGISALDTIVYNRYVVPSNYATSTNQLRLWQLAKCIVHPLICCSYFQICHF